MEPDRNRGGALPEAWLDIPDALRRPIAPRPAPVALAADRSPTRGELKVQRLAALAACVLWPAAVLVAWGFRPRVDANFGFLAAQTLLFTALLVVAMVTSVSSGRRGLGQPVRLIALATVGMPLVFVLLALLWLAPDASSGFGDVGPLGQVPACVLLGSLVAAPMLAVSAWSLRRSFPSGAAWRGGALGTACGLAAAVVLTLHCGSSFGGHIALAHGGPLLLATLAGAVVGSKLGQA
jgi:hypothetical protein